MTLTSSGPSRSRAVVVADRRAVVVCDVVVVIFSGRKRAAVLLIVESLVEGRVGVVSALVCKVLRIWVVVAALASDGPVEDAVDQPRSTNLVVHDRP